MSSAQHRVWPTTAHGERAIATFVPSACTECLLYAKLNWILSPSSSNEHQKQISTPYAIFA